MGDKWSIYTGLTMKTQFSGWIGNSFLNILHLCCTRLQNLTFNLTTLLVNVAVESTQHWHTLRMTLTRNCWLMYSLQWFNPYHYSLRSFRIRMFSRQFFFTILKLKHVFFYSSYNITQMPFEKDPTWNYLCSVCFGSASFADSDKNCSKHLHKRYLINNPVFALCLLFWQRLKISTSCQCIFTVCIL